MAAEIGGDELLQKLNELGHELLGDWLLKPATRAAWKPMSLDLFPDARLKAIAKCANDGVHPDDLPLALSRNGVLAIWPHPADATDFLLRVASHGLSFDRLQKEIQEISDKQRLRDKLQDNVRRIGAKTLDQVVADIEKLRPPELVKPFETATVADLFAPLGKEPWLCEALALQPGAPIMLSGHSARGKSWIAYDLALAIASGQTFGGFPVRQGKARWFHLEGSSRDLRKRLQRLAAGRALGPQDLEGQLFNVIHPQFSFTDPTLEGRLAAECDGFAIAVIDTFAVAAAGMKENDASIRQPLDMLARVSERTGCTFLVIHHHRKDPQDPRQKVDQEMGVRGSGALVNAISVGWAVSRVGKSDAGGDVLFRSKLTMTKSWYGNRDPLIVTGAWSSFTEGAVEVTVAGVPDEAPEAAPVDAPEDEDFTELDNAIIDAVALHKEVNMTALCGLVKRRGAVLRERVAVLLMTNRIAEEIRSHGRRVLSPVKAP